MPAAHTFDTASMSDVAAQVTIVILSYNGEQYLPRTLDALLALRTGCRIVLIDDGSTDDTTRMMARSYPQVEVLSLGANTGRIGRARKRAVEECRTPYLFLVDNDVTFAPDCLQRLLQRLHERPQAFSCRPRLLYADRPEVVYQDANRMHYLALAADQRRGMAAKDLPQDGPQPTIGGGIMMLDVAHAHRLGNFDERFLFGFSDSELDVRALLYGYEVLNEPRALGYHIERPGGLLRVTGQLYNRRRLIATCYSTRSLLVLGPPLLAFEIIVLLMCLASGYRKQYWQAMKLLRSDWPDIRERRRRIQGERVHARDDVVLSSGRISITGRMSGSRVVPMLSPILSTVFNAYWHLVGPLVRERRRRAHDPRTSTPGGNPDG